MSNGPVDFSNMEVTIQAPKDFHSPSFSRPVAMIRRSYLTHARKYVGSASHEDTTAGQIDPDTAGHATPEDRGIQLTDTVLRDTREALNLAKELDKAKLRQSLIQAYRPSYKLTVQRLSLKPTLKVIRFEPEVVLGTKGPLEVKKITPKPMLRVLEAVQATEVVLDESKDSPISAVDDFTMHGLDSPVSDFENGFEDFGTGEHLEDFITFKEVPEIRLDSDDWPLPKEVPEFPFTQPMLVAHPDPLRSHPLVSNLRKCRSKSSLQSITSNKSNRAAFVMQKNGSSLSLHSQGTVTDMTNMLVSASLNHHKARSFMHLKRSDARQISIASTVLTPVTETFEKLNAGRDSYTNSDTVSDRKRPSASLGVSSTKPSRFKSFNGAMVGTSRRERRMLR